MTKIFKKILIIEDEPGLLQLLKLLLSGEGYEPVCAKNGQEGLNIALNDKEIDLIITDVKLPGMDGIEILKAVKKECPQIVIIVMSAYGTIELAVEALKNGAFTFIAKPFRKDFILHNIRQAEERELLKDENRLLRERLQTKENETRLIGRNKDFLRIIQKIDKIAPFDTTVLILGESGTGKELAARRIHKLSNRKHNFTSVNCAAIPRSLLESELFGHAEGAFTGAHKKKNGLFLEASGGTLFLDEIGELPLELQAKLLRVLQEGEVRPVGSNQNIRVDFRLIAATSKDLTKEVTRGAFREDLFYRLNVVPITMPALRQRKDDIPVLTEFLLEKYCKKLGLKKKRVKRSVYGELEQYDWPGNVRELENIIERMVILVDEEEISLDDLPDMTGSSKEKIWGKFKQDGFSIKKSTRNLEKYLIEKALNQTRGKRGEAAKLLEISERTLLYKIKDYELDPKNL
ncbi:MAG: sigma-54 dependent transcriptional regulator [Deltaproteobacteria bacterium]|nr:sigma-54 dependent transcriptional regulator [Deltaproteobacteria bacterium]